MKLYCPHCGVKGVADDSYQGKKVKCPKCLEIFVAIEPVAEDRKVADEPAADAAEALIPAESQAELRDGEEKLTEPEPLGPAEESVPVEAVPADEPRAAEAVEEAVEVKEEEPLIPPADDVRREEEKEAVLDWDEIAAEIEAKTAAEDLREAEEKEGLPAGLFAETAKEEQGVTAEPEVAEPPAIESAGPGDRLTDRDEVPRAVAETVARQEEPPAPAARAEEGREDHFIFEDQTTATEQPVQVEDKPYGVIKEQCWQCGKKNRTGVPFTARGGRMYCPACMPAAEPELAPEPPAFAGQSAGGPPPLHNTVHAGTSAFMAEPSRFTIGGALRQAWEQTRGAKGPILAGSAVMYLTILFLAAGGGFMLPMFGQDSTDPNLGVTGQIGNLLFQLLIDAVSVLFTAGLLFMGIRKVAGDPISWKMIFTGFSDSGKIIVATILQSVLIIIGFLILVLPGIYLAIGYSMTIPLIVDRKMSPWQAMETSRQAVHRVWWRVVGLYFVMGLLFVVSMVPLGIGLIWTWPMFVVLVGVVYRYLFVSEK